MLNTFIKGTIMEPEDLMGVLSFYTHIAVVNLREDSSLMHKIKRVRLCAFAGVTLHEARQITPKQLALFDKNMNVQIMWAPYQIDLG
jgi:hypothetical protein